MAHHDPLTGLANRTLLRLRLRSAIERSVRTASPCALLFLDLDGFKRVNDQLGHDAGDELLRQVTARLRRRVRETDVLARMGGDEFVLVMDSIDCHQDASAMAELLVRQFDAPFRLSCGRQVGIGVSLGISCCPAHGFSEETLLHNADTALYAAKAAGRRTWRLHTSEEPSAAAAATFPRPDTDPLGKCDWAGYEALDF